MDEEDVEGLNSDDALLKALNFYCEKVDTSFEACLDFERSYLSKLKLSKCIDYCQNEAEDLELEPKFQDMAPPIQTFEKCLDEFGPHDIFDYNDKKSIKKDDMVRVFLKKGFVMVKNFFPKKYMQKLTQIMHQWDDYGAWNNLTFADFYCHDENKLNNYENRLEIMIPYVPPFDNVFYDLHNSTLMEVMREYSHHRPIHMEFPSSIMS